MPVIDEKCDEVSDFFLFEWNERTKFIAGEARYEGIWEVTSTWKNDGKK